MCNRRRGNEVWQLHSAARLIVRGGDNPRLRGGIPRPLQVGLQHDSPVHHVRFFLIVPLPVRRVMLLGDRPGSVDDGVVDLAGLVGEAGALHEGLGPEEFVEEEIEVAAGNHR